MKLEKIDYLEDLIDNVGYYNLYAIGDIQRFEANKLILNKEINYVPMEKINNKEILPDKNTIIITCGQIEDQVKTKLFADKYQVVDMAQIINYKTAKYWDQTKNSICEGSVHFAFNPFIVKHLKKNISLYECLNKYFSNRKDLTCLSLGCGCGRIEQNLVTLGVFKKIDACDISEESIKIAKNNAKKMGNGNIINYFLFDINKDTLKTSEYDFIIANACMHHIENLEFAYYNISSALKNDGIFYQAEFIGPDRFQYSKKVRDTVKHTLKLFPKKWKRSDICNNASIEYMLGLDPSEAIRSSEIIDLSKRYFNVLEINYLRNTLVHFIYNRNIQTEYFHTKNGKPFSNKLRSIFLCKLLCKIEKTFLKEEESDNAQIIAGKK